MTATHLYQTGIIGNCSYIAHIHKNTNISWLCWPKFDSSFVFGSMLDEEKGGKCTVLPTTEYSSHQYYIENTNVLRTEITAADGKYRITDFAPRFRLYERYFKPLMLVRKIEPLEGNPRVKIACEPVCDYGKAKMRAAMGSNHIDYFGCEEDMRLTTNVSLNYILQEQDFVLNDVKYLIFTYGYQLDAPVASTAEQFLTDTTKYWRTWIKHSSIAGFYQPQVIRSALVLKIHQYEDTGAIIAASTTSLPESPGSTRNWDYRYCWLRDSFYVLTSLNHIGHFEEMEKYFNYISDITFDTDERYQPLYGITGKRLIVEETLGHLNGYLGEKPIRVGNQAYEHIQNDINGQVLISMLPLYSDHRFVFSERGDSVRWIDGVLKKIEMTIDEKDGGFGNLETLQIHIVTVICFNGREQMRR